MCTLQGAFLCAIYVRDVFTNAASTDGRMNACNYDANLNAHVCAYHHIVHVCWKWTYALEHKRANTLTHAWIYTYTSMYKYMCKYLYAYVFSPTCWPTFVNHDFFVWTHHHVAHACMIMYITDLHSDVLKAKPKKTNVKQWMHHPILAENKQSFGMIPLEMIPIIWYNPPTTIWDTTVIVDSRLHWWDGPGQHWTRADWVASCLAGHPQRSAVYWHPPN